MAAGLFGSLLDKSVDVDEVVVSGDGVESDGFGGLGVGGSDVISVEVDSSAVSVEVGNFAQELFLFVIAFEGGDEIQIGDDVLCVSEVVLPFQHNSGLLFSQVFWGKTDILRILDFQVF